MIVVVMQDVTQCQALMETKVALFLHVIIGRPVIFNQLILKLGIHTENNLIQLANHVLIVKKIDHIVM